MSFHQLEGAVPAVVSGGLPAFESQFYYPLGPGQRFRIDHGIAYTAFYSTLGENVCFVAEEHGRVLGTLSACVRMLRSPGAAPRRVCYIGDFKVDPSARGGLVAAGLLRKMVRWCRERSDAAYSVVMEGTASVPAAYTGRIGVPLFHPIGRLAILRLEVDGADRDADLELWQRSMEETLLRFSELGRSSVYLEPGESSARSLMRPIGLVAPDGGACGVLEDTRKVKKLFAEDGREIASAHLSHFGWTDPASARGLIKAALALCRRERVSHLFVTFDENAAAVLNDAEASQAVTAPAVIYGTGFSNSAGWLINSSEV